MNGEGLTEIAVRTGPEAEGHGMQGNGHRPGFNPGNLPRKVFLEGREQKLALKVLIINLGLPDFCSLSEDVCKMYARSMLGGLKKSHYFWGGGELKNER